MELHRSLSLYAKFTVKSKNPPASQKVWPETLSLRHLHLCDVAKGTDVTHNSHRFFLQ